MLGRIVVPSDKTHEPRIRQADRSLGVGINHSHRLLQIRDRESGGDLYPLLGEKDKSYDASFEPLTRRLLHAFGFG